MKHLVLLIVLFISLSLSADPPKPTWPSEFAMPFGLHFTTLLKNASATLYYNFDQVFSLLYIFVND
jgi:hypothetical protein